MVTYQCPSDDMIVTVVMVLSEDYLKIGIISVVTLLVLW